LEIQSDTNYLNCYDNLMNFQQDKNTTRWNLNLCIPLFISVSEVSTIEWE